MSTPYPEPHGEGFTSGWSGSETSHERAVSEDASGTTHYRQNEVVRLLGRHTRTVKGLMGGREAGLTVADIREWTGWHHGQASSALSVLHKEGKIARLTERRDRCAVYVLPEYVDGRETAPHGRQKRALGLSGAEKRVLHRLNASEGSVILLPSEKGVLLGLIDRLTDG
jgi:hypothetical protein